MPDNLPDSESEETGPLSTAKEEKMKYESLVRAILNEIGGEHNIASVTHCMTRLRFTLKDESKANIENVKNITGVVG